ncbi:MAG: hypothetical protein ACO3Z6_15005 [Pseudomonadales bacterium]|jgi:hypothetical protein
MALKAVDSKNPEQKIATSPRASERGSVLDDPFGSMYVGLIAPAAAVGAVVSGILGLSIFY